MGLHRLLCRGLLYQHPLPDVLVRLAFLHALNAVHVRVYASCGGLGNLCYWGVPGMLKTICCRFQLFIINVYSVSLFQTVAAVTK